MWWEGVLYHEIAKLFDIPCAAVHLLIRERVPMRQRTAQTAGRLEDERSSEDRLLDGIRKAASALAEAPVVEAEDRHHIQAVIDGWLAAHSELTDPADMTSSAAQAEAAGATSPNGRLSPADLHGELNRFKAELRAGGLRESTIHSYVTASRLFVRWLAHDYVPGPSRADRVAPGRPS